MTYLRYLMISVCLLAGCTSIPRPALRPTDAWLYDSIVFDIHPITGAMPDSDELEKTRRYLELHRICAPSHVKFVVQEELPWSSKDLWTINDLRGYELARAGRRLLLVNTRNLNIFVAYLDSSDLHGPQ